VGLSMDALAVSVTNGCVMKKFNFLQATGIAFSFGFFQAVMPLIGWAAGTTLYVYISSFDHWIAFALLSFIGGKMLYESLTKEEGCSDTNCLHFPTLMTLSVATSIDALAVGISFAALNIRIITPILIIGAITFVLCLIGIYVGKRIGHLFEKSLERIGGVILIGMGIKILIEHLFLAAA